VKITSGRERVAKLGRVERLSNHLSPPPINSHSETPM